MNPSTYLPDSVLRAQAYLRSQLSPYPGRVNIMLRCMLTSAIVLVVSMALQVPELPLSLLVVFYVTQSNVVVTRLVGVMFMVGSTLAVGLSILVLKLTFDYPLLRIVAASALFFGSVYLMRVLKIGIIFFIVAIVVIYVQTFVDRTDQAELLIRAVLWVWVAVNYPIALTLLINTLLLPAEPQQQLKAEIHRQLDAVDIHLSRLIDGTPVAEPITPLAIQQGALTLQKLLKFATMRDARYRHDMAHQLACVAIVSRLYRAAAELPDDMPGPSAAQLAALRQLRTNCQALDAALAADNRYQYTPPAAPAQGGAAPLPAAAEEMQRALVALADADSAAGAAAKAPPEPPMMAPDALTNPAYARFALKTLLAVLICYVFYTAADWQGAHTIMLTCLIVALPSLGASMQRAMLRVGGALTGSALALFMVVFVVPRLESIQGLLLMTLPVVALAAWIAAGSERVSYAGIQILFTFSLALLGKFGPTIDLTEIRDRVAGILLGVAIATLIQMSVWREAEGDVLRQKLAGMLRAVARLLQPAAAGTMPGHLTYAQQELQTWAVLSDCEDTLARVTLEPNWQEGEHALLTLRAQAVLAQGREIMLAGIALHNALESGEIRPGSADDDAMRAFQAQAAALLGHYADALIASPPSAQSPRPAELAVPGDRHFAGPVLSAMHNLVRQLCGLPEWQAAAAPSSMLLRESHDAG
ncbi:FUSC family protein [Cupriavidus sp. IDO]|uniref:FUSC family protein n=1 Tax=Cupriavidus sp. IDO TaxID=1539142 RepID=UPI00057994FC|nr:FUSC family protein [Cupriavidus sp. IDO]KWR90495.1 multidrug transporter [Cupriavidus sp. IDO]